MWSSALRAYDRYGQCTCEDSAVNEQLAKLPASDTASPIAGAAMVMLAWKYQPVLVEALGKKPAAGDGWQNVRYSLEDFDAVMTAFTPQHNIGVHLEASHLVDADLDSPWARRLAPAFLPKSTMM